MEKWLKWAIEIQGLAQSGLAYTTNVYDIERYERLREISAEMIEEKSNINLEKVKDLFCKETGYQTPKIDTRAAIFKDNKILLVHENNGTWSLPGGWCDVRNRHNRPIYAYGICKIFVMCEIIGGEFKENIETTEMKYFALDELPENFANEKCTKEQVEMCFRAKDDDNWQVQFD